MPDLPTFGQDYKDKKIMPWGKYQDQPLQDILKDDPEYLRFIYYHSGYDGWIKDWILENLISIK